MAQNRFARGNFFPPPPDGGVPKAHSKDPQLYPSRAYIPVRQSDLSATERLRAPDSSIDNEGLNWGQGGIPPTVRNGLGRLAHGPEWVENHTFINATPLWQSPRVVLISATDTPVKLFDANVRRLAFTIANQTVNTLFFSYNFPIKDGTTFLGIPIGAAIGVFPNGAGFFPGSNGQASIQEIYVWLSAGATVPARVMGFEAVLATDANLG